MDDHLRRGQVTDDLRLAEQFDAFGRDGVAHQNPAHLETGDLDLGLDLSRLVDEERAIELDRAAQGTQKLDVFGALQPAADPGVGLNDRHWTGHLQRPTSMSMLPLKGLGSTCRASAQGRSIAVAPRASESKENRESSKMARNVRS